MTEALVPIRRALLSVSDKNGLIEFAHALNKFSIELISTGGTARTLNDQALAVRDVAQVTGHPEILGGRVKTLHPKIHGGILAVRDNEDHLSDMRANEIEPIDLVVVNLYPFEKSVAEDASFAQCVEMIDIGGPAMIRAAAKSFRHILVATSPEQYEEILATLNQYKGSVPLELRRRYAQTAFDLVSKYDRAIADYMSAKFGGNDEYDRSFQLTGDLVQTLRYGENSHQSAALYRTDSQRPGVVNAEQMQGKELSYNNIADGDAAFELACSFPVEQGCACAIIKHANPCGVAVGSTPLIAYKNALRCDPVSAFGGIIAFNQTLDAEAAKEVILTFTELILAPEITEEARAIIATKPNIRLLRTFGLSSTVARDKQIKTVAGGFILQTSDSEIYSEKALRVVSKRTPTEQEQNDMMFAWRVAKYVKSNAIVFAKDQATLGIGAGQMNRRDSTRIAVRKAGDIITEDNNILSGSVAASDAFFPFADGLIEAAEAGATAIIQPGGAMRDEEIIAEADARNIAMIFTNMRHFRH